jgi:hypothetical protein
VNDEVDKGIPKVLEFSLAFQASLKLDLLAAKTQVCAYS